MGSPAAENAGRPRLGIDLGGTKIAGIVLSRDGTTLAEARMPAPRGAYRATVEAVADLVLRLEAEAGAPCSVGIGMPGSLSPATGLVRNANSHWLNGHPFAADLGARLERPLRIENDANCLAVSEAIDGAGAGASVVWAVILGTGVGSGIALDGRVLTGRNGIAGEWGHGPLPTPRDDERPGAACYCGRRGCVETWLSGPGLAADHARRHGGSLAAEAHIVVVFYHFGAYKAILEVGMDYTGTLRSLPAFAVCPGFHLHLSGRNECFQIEQRVCFFDQSVDAALLQSELVEKHLFVLVGLE